MVIKSGKGTGGIIVSKKNRGRIQKYFIENPGSTISECARALNLTWPTVKSHVVAIQDNEKDH